MYSKVEDDSSSEEQVQVINLATLDHTRVNKPDLRERLLDDVTSGNSILEHAERLFPRLGFGKKSREQLKDILGTEPYFREVIRHLDILNETMENWQSGPYDPSGVDWSVESESTLQQYGDTRKFSCVDGVVRQFSSHTKITISNSNKRIYYYPECPNGLVHIGYVGDHLRTARY